MKYISTRGQANQLNFQDVLLSGLARDGGLYVPQQWPEISFNELESFVGLSYHEIAIRVMKPFVGNTFPEDKFRSMVYDAYSEFEDVNVCPISAIAEDHYLLELFHGPTMAFKDIAMQLIGQMFDYTQAKQINCNIITMPPKVIRQINGFGKSYKSMTLDTVKGFLVDSKKSRFSL